MYASIHAAGREKKKFFLRAQVKLKYQMYRYLSHRLDGAYNHPRREIVGREILLKKGIKTAMEEKQFVLHYQPQIEIASGRLVGVEALLRW